ncbi:MULTISPECIES: hypothetical protein [unclassified Flavobacterium]|uniref:hypothetical protein n=1 Tax=unclassified Flavobacterium TaxID=196869 RepID=UPI001F1382B7|nr:MULTISPECIES: hypothetical protein [unclassified Flavobacterium]UMY64687.1 hypothetical protein MKO97_09195 [Flavobacterium sp. HJ-32-4]
MRYYLLFFLLLQTLIGCQKPNEDFYVIDDAAPSTDFYGPVNFVLLDSTAIFVHQKRGDYFCGTFLDFSKPPRLNLVPRDLVEIPIDALPDALRKIPDSLYGPKTTISIASSQKVIRTPAVKTIIDYYQKRGISYHVRLWTEEEAYASRAKKDRTAYDPRKQVFKDGFADDELRK